MSSRSRPRAIAAALLLLALALPAVAQAAHRRVAVLRLEFRGDVPENGQFFLSQRLIEGLAAADFQVFAGLVVTQMLKQGERLETCRAADCYREIARRLGVEYLVTGAVEVEQKNYEVSLDLVAGRDGKTVGQSREKCELCGIKEAGQQMDKQVLGLRELAMRAAADAPARYAVESRPSGAEVLVDGKAAGLTPLTVDVPAGLHRIALQAPGHAPVERSLEVQSGTSGLLSMDLPPKDATDAIAQRHRRLRIAGLSTIAAGVLAGVVGGVVLAADKEVLACDVMIDLGCLHEKKSDTALAASLIFAGSGVLLGAGGVMLYLGRSDAGSDRGAAGGDQAWLLGASGRF